MHSHKLLAAAAALAGGIFIAVPAHAQQINGGTQIRPGSVTVDRLATTGTPTASTWLNGLYQWMALPVGSASQLGLLEPDGTSITAAAGIISAVALASTPVNAGHIATEETYNGTTEYVNFQVVWNIDFGESAPVATQGDVYGWEISTNSGTTWGSEIYANGAYPAYPLSSGTVRFRTRLHAQNGSIGSWVTTMRAPNGAITSDITYAAPPTTASGTVTSVALALPASTFTVSGSPVSSTGTLTGAFAAQSANTFLSGPSSGSATVPTWRQIVSGDLPTTAVTPGSYNNANITVGADGRLTSAANGTGGGGTYTGTAPIVVSGSTISANVATGSTFGTIEPDNSTITVSSGVISSVGGVVHAVTVLPAATSGNRGQIYLLEPALSTVYPAPSGVLCRFDASEITGLTSGSAVGTWNDMSGAGDNAIQTGTATYQTNILNGLPGVYFASSSGYFTLHAPVPAGACTVFAVEKFAADSMIMTSAAAAGQVRVYQGGRGSNMSTYDGTNNPYVTITTTVGNPDVLTYQFSAATGGTVTFYEGTGNLGSFASNQPSEQYIGPYSGSDNGYLFELIVVGGTMTAGSITAVQNYLTAKWLTGTASDKLYVSALVAGSYAMKQIF